MCNRLQTEVAGFLVSIPHYKVVKMAGVGDVNVQFLINVPAGDPLERPCTIIGKKRNLKTVSFPKLSPYLGERTSSKVSVQ